MVGMKPREKEEVIAATEKGKTFGTVSTITTESKQDKEQLTQETVGDQEKRTIGSRAPSAELGDLMTKLDKIDEKLKSSDKEYQELKKELRHNKNGNLDSYFVLASATEKKLQQMENKVETNDKEREKNVKKDIEEMKKQYDKVNEKLWNLETRIETMSKDQAESFCAIQSNLDAFLRNSLTKDKSVAHKQTGTRVDFVEPQRKKI